MKKPSAAPKIAQHVNPIVIMIGILLLATGLTYIVDSGAFERDGRLVVPGSFQSLEKDASLLDLLAIPSGEPASFLWCSSSAACSVS
jgi:uncharacterized ion transporter superfamily protein YfcC